MDRATLEQLALEKMSKAQTVPSSNFDRSQLEQMALEKLSGKGLTEINPEEEASLGFVNRSRYAIEPLQSNRKALLVQEYGDDNVLEDKKGELYVKQNGQFLPVNKEGFSSADIADFAGATPEIAGGVVGTIAGAIGGGGVASIPAALAVGAGGGALGSAARQAFSGTLGTPQVAGLGERVAETGLSGVFGAGGAGLGVIAQRAKPGLTQVLKNLSGRSSDVAESALKTFSTSTANTDLSMAGKIIPEFEKPSVKAIMGEVADESGRDAVKAEMTKLTDIAKRQGIPKPTYAQAAQGKALIAETKIMDTPLIGGRVRKQVDGQIKAIKNNLENITGKAIDAKSTSDEVGIATRDYAETALEAQKRVAQELYEQVEDVGKNASIPAQSLYRKFQGGAQRLGLINPDQTRAKYSADLGLTREEFNQLQGAFFDGLDAIRNSKTKAKGTGTNPLAVKIPFENANALRRTLRNTAEELRGSNPSAARRLKSFSVELDQTLEGILNKEHPQMGEIFRTANKQYSKFKGQEEVLGKILKEGTGDEKTVKYVMGDTTRIKAMKEIIGEDKVRDIGKSYIADALSTLKDSGIGRADAAKKYVEKNAAQIKEAVGEKTFNDLIENLEFLNRTGQPIGVSRASLYNLLDNRGPGLKSLALNLAGGAKTIAESKGISSGTVVKRLGKVAEKAGFKDLSSYSNILSDTPQRGASSVSPLKKISEREQEIEKRKRAISGSKNGKN